MWILRVMFVFEIIMVYFVCFSLFSKFSYGWVFFVGSVILLGYDERGFLVCLI